MPLFKPVVLGLIGKKRSGKDTVFAILNENPEVYRIAFADALKQELARACDLSVEFLEMHKEAFRLGLQWWGSEFRRGLFTDSYWLDRARDRFNHCLLGNPNLIVFTDVRFPNEVEFVRHLGGKLWRICRESVETSGDKHASETALDEFIPDRAIHNNGTIEDLDRMVQQAFKEDFGWWNEEGELCAKH